MLAKFVSACGGIQYKEISDKYLYDNIMLPVATDLDYISYKENTPTYPDFMIRTFRYENTTYDELHHKRIAVYKEYIKKVKL